MELPQGTLDVLILKALGLEPLHGWAVSERLQQISSDALRSTRARFIRRCTGWSGAVGSRRSGELRITIAKPSITT